MQPMVTVLPERHRAEAPVADDTTLPAGSGSATTAPKTITTPGSGSAVTAPKTITILARETRRLGRVLVVDDDEVIRRLIAANLTVEGFDVAMAVDGQDCLDKVSALAPDVVTLDGMLPRLDGWETATRLRKCPDTAHIKVVLVTARVQDGDPARRRHVDADAYLIKPFDAAELIRVVRELAATPPTAFA